MMPATWSVSTAEGQEPLRRRHFNLLGVEVSLADDWTARADYVDAFLDAYAEPWRLGVHRSLTVSARAGDPAPGQAGPGELRPVHRTKHRYWNFDAEVCRHPSGAVSAIWPSRDLFVELAPGARQAAVMLGERVPPATSGEALFHLCRNLALYLRSTAAGKLLHASAVAFDLGAVAFVGGVSAGKTTAMIECLFSFGARPLSNDRVLIDHRRYPWTHSWPSYTSLCEGTLLRYPVLREAALEYERDRAWYRTQRWNAPLSPRFDKSSKRVYPMLWLTRAVGRGFGTAAPLAAIVAVEIRPGLAEEVRRLPLDTAAEREAMAARMAEHDFDGREPSFRPWHGLPIPRRQISLRQMMDGLHGAGCTAYELRTDPVRLRPALGRLLDQVATGRRR